MRRQEAYENIYSFYKCKQPSKWYLFDLHNNSKQNKGSNLCYDRKT